MTPPGGKCRASFSSRVSSVIFSLSLVWEAAGVVLGAAAFSCYAAFSWGGSFEQLSLLPPG
jgi:hypothetical protein